MYCYFVTTFTPLRLFTSMAFCTTPVCGDILDRSLREFDSKPGSIPVGTSLRPERHGAFPAARLFYFLPASGASACWYFCWYRQQSKAKSYISSNGYWIKRLSARGTNLRCCATSVGRPTSPISDLIFKQPRTRAVLELSLRANESRERAPDGPHSNDDLRKANPCDRIISVSVFPDLVSLIGWESTIDRLNP